MSYSMGESLTVCGVWKSAPLQGRQGKGQGWQFGQVRDKEQLQQVQGNKQSQGLGNEAHQHVLGSEQPKQLLGKEQLEQARAAEFTGKRAGTIMVT